MGSDQGSMHPQARLTNNDQHRQPIMGNHQLVIISQLLQIVTGMQHIDELLLWLARSLVKRLDIGVIQLWALQQDMTHQANAELRVMTSQNGVLPPYVIANTQIAELAERILQKKLRQYPQSVFRSFPLHQATLLTDYNLHYWACYVLDCHCLLPPSKSDASLTGKIPTPLTMLVSLFFEHTPEQRLIPTVGHILERTLRIAKNQGLLLVEGEREPQVPPPVSRALQPALPAPPAQTTHRKNITWLDLIPYRVQVDNPFSGTILLTDQQTHQLYLAIDGHRNLRQLLATTKLGIKDFYRALRTLLSQRDIHLYEPGGRLVDSAQLLQSL